MKHMMTPEEARALLDNVAKNAPEKLLAASNSIALAALEIALAAHVTLEKARRVSNQCVAAIKALQGADSAPVESVAGQPISAPPSSGGRMRADGTPMSPEECAIEDAMDEACAPHPGLGRGPSSGPSSPPPVETSAEEPPAESPPPPPPSRPAPSKKPTSKTSK